MERRYPCPECPYIKDELGAFCKKCAEARVADQKIRVAPVASASDGPEDMPFKPWVGPPWVDEPRLYDEEVEPLPRLRFLASEFGGDCG